MFDDATPIPHQSKQHEKIREYPQLLRQLSSETATNSTIRRIIRISRDTKLNQSESSFWNQWFTETIAVICKILNNPHAV